MATRSALQPRKGVSAAVLARTGEAGRSIASSRPSQSRAAEVANTLPAPLITAGTRAAASSSRTSSASALSADEHGDVARAQRLVADRLAGGRSVLDPRVRGQQRDDVGGDVGGDVLAGRAGGGEAALGELRSRVVAVDDAHAQRGIARRARQPRRLVRRRGADLPVDDPLVAELGAGEQRVVGVDQRLVAAAVLAQRRARPAVAAALR